MNHESRKRPTCKSCKCFEPFSEEWPNDLGKCRKKPPVICDYRCKGNWPEVNGTIDWCGEHKPEDRLATPEVVG